MVETKNVMNIHVMSLTPRRHRIIGPRGEEKIVEMH